MPSPAFLPAVKAVNKAFRSVAFLPASRKIKQTALHTQSGLKPVLPASDRKMYSGRRTLHCCLLDTAIIDIPAESVNYIIKNKKHRAYARWGKPGENCLASKLDLRFRPVFPAPLLFTGPSSCPAWPDKKHRAYARWGKPGENCLTSKLDVCFLPVFPALRTVTFIFLPLQWHRSGPCPLRRISGTQASWLPGISVSPPGTVQ